MNIDLSISSKKSQNQVAPSPLPTIFLNPVLSSFQDDYIISTSSKVTQILFASTRIPVLNQTNPTNLLASENRGIHPPPPAQIILHNGHEKHEFDSLSMPLEYFREKN